LDLVVVTTVGKAPQQDSIRRSMMMPVELPIELRAFLVRHPEQIHVSFPVTTTDNKKEDRLLDATLSMRKNQDRSTEDL